MRQPIERKTVYRVTFTYLDIDGICKGGTRWYDSIIDIPTKYFKEDNSQLWQRSFDVFQRPPFAEFKKCVENNDRYWLNTNEEIKELV